MVNIIEFNNGDLFFEPVLSFYVSWISFPFHQIQIPKGAKIVMKGSWRGMIIPQLRYNDSSIYDDLAQLKPIRHLEFFPDFNPAKEPSGLHLNDSYLVKFWAQQMFGHAYELAQQKIQVKYGTERKNNWPSELQFAYHVRNGCFHGNKFDIRPNSISKKIPTIWMGKEIKYSDNGKKVSQGFMWPADFIHLLYDIQKILS